MWKMSVNIIKHAPISDVTQRNQSGETIQRWSLGTDRNTSKDRPSDRQILLDIDYILYSIY